MVNAVTNFDHCQFVGYWACLAYFRNRNMCVDGVNEDDALIVSSSTLDPPGSEYGPRCFGGPRIRRRHCGLIRVRYR